jgi:hypothetical protein
VQAVKYEVQPAEPAVSDKPKRRWFQFSLKTLLVALTLLCLGPGGYVAYEQNKARKEKAAVKAIEKLGGSVYYFDYFEKQTVRSPMMRQILGDESFGNAVELQFYDTHVADADLAHLSALKHLNRLSLVGTQVTDAGLVHLAGLKALRILDLDDTQVAGPGFVDLAGLKRLKYLSLARTQINDDGLENLSGLTSLEELGLQHTLVSDAGLPHLTNLRSLTNLSLDGTSVSDAGLVHLAKLRTLTSLSLARTQVSDEGLMQLASLKNLKDLTLPQGVSVIGRWELQKTLPKCYITISPY